MQDWTLGLPSAIALSIQLAQTVGLAVARRESEPPPIPGKPPRVSILKPLAGEDDDLEANLESFMNLDYPDYEVLLGVASLSDSAVAVARRIVDRFPTAQARLVLTHRDSAMNPKVAQLLGLAAEATGEVLVVSDSNVRVERWYLRDGVSRLHQDNVAMVTHLFAGCGEESAGAAIENLQLNGAVTPGVATLARIGPRPLTIGKSMFIWKTALDAVGGFESVGNYVAEDHALGDLFLGEGRAVVVSPAIVQNRNTTCSIQRTFERHLRWAKMRRSISPTLFLFEPILSPVVIATFVALAHPSRFSVGCLLVACCMQVTLAAVTTELLRAKSIALRYLPLELVRPWLIFMCWLLAWMSRTIRWRGNQLTMDRGTRIAHSSETWSAFAWLTSLRKRIPRLSRVSLRSRSV